MNLNRPSKAGRGISEGEAFTDPLSLQEALESMIEQETEFSIKVEGTSTLPYASHVQAVDLEPGHFILRLVRPLPHELLGGASFQMMFTVEGQRYEGVVSYVGREGYLQYRFLLPTRITFADRRSQMRHPFRPRESAYVIAADGRIPSLGVAGPLVNIGMGGLALRVDRVLKLEDGMRIPSNTALFERGLSFPRIRIQDLPRLPFLELTGRVAHATERGGEVILGMAFGEMEDEQARLLNDCLTFRDRIFKSTARTSPSSSGAITTSATKAGARGTEASLETENEVAIPYGMHGSSEGVSTDPLVLLRRRVQKVFLVAQNPDLIQRFRQVLHAAGYVRLEIFESFTVMAAFLKDHSGKIDLVIVDLSIAGAGDVEPLAGVRLIEHQLDSFGKMPRAILCETVDPTLLLSDSKGTHFLSHGDAADRIWVEALDQAMEVGNGIPPSE